jgi:hypothetical protein
MVQLYSENITGGSAGNAVTWRVWNGDTGTGTGTITGSGTWHIWTGNVGNGDSGTISSVTCGSNTVTWQYWVSGTCVNAASTQISSNVWTPWVEKVEETAAQKAERIAREEARRAELAEMARLNALRAEQAQKERMEAEARAEVLLLENLEEEERNRYLRAGYFYVFSKSGKKYKVKKGTHGNVYLMDPITDKEQVRYCVQPGGVPVGDANLAQALFLKHAEAEFLAKANATRLYN